MHIPPRKFFQLDTIPAFQESTTGCAQSMGEATFRVMNHFASEIKMDPLFLACNARIIMEHNNWLLETNDETKRTPFMVALDLFELVMEADKIKRAKAEEDARRAANLERAGIMQKEHKERLAELATRDSKDRTCLACNSNTFTYYYPKDKSKGWVNDALPLNELDPDWHCSTCKKMICLACKSTLCLEMDEMLDMICNDCQKKKCQLCSQIIMTQHTLEHNVCLSCFNTKRCTTCKQFNADCTQMNGLIQCTGCTAKCVVCKENLQIGDSQICQTCRQYDYES